MHNIPRGNQASTSRLRHAGDVAIVDLEGRLTLGEDCSTVRHAVRDLVNRGSRNILLNLHAGPKRCGAFSGSRCEPH